MILSSREVEVLKLFCLGYSARGIAHALNIAVRTVESHRYHIGKKTQCTSGPQLGVWAAKNGIVQ